MRSFPEAAPAMVRCARERRSIRFSTTEMMEEFARETQRAVSRGDPELAKRHLTFLSDRLRNADEIEYEYIDVYYVEGILYGVEDGTRQEIWSLMPVNLRDLYVAMWGHPTFS
jgi:hypothetical protein